MTFAPYTGQMIIWADDVWFLCDCDLQVFGFKFICALICGSLQIFFHFEISIPISNGMLLSSSFDAVR